MSGRLPANHLWVRHLQRQVLAMLAIGVVAVVVVVVLVPSPMRGADGFLVAPSPPSSCRQNRLAFHHRYSSNNREKRRKDAEEEASTGGVAALFDQRRRQEEASGGGSGGKQQENRENKNPIDFLFNPYESKIPKEIEAEIYEAEGNTAAAKDRTARIALYALVAFLGVGCAFFNGFLTELRSAPPPGLAAVEGGDAVEPFVLETSAFAWVGSNFLARFLFLNKIGGGLCLVLGGGAGLLAEAEYDTRRINAEKIWEEMQRRRSAAEERKSGKPKKNKRRRRAGKESKRLGALSEVVTAAAVDDEGTGTAAASAAAGDEPMSQASVVQDGKKTKKEADGAGGGAGGMLGGLKDFYDKADKMAQTQALLLNKKLEEEGIVEKITDESGLRVIGKDAVNEMKAKGGHEESSANGKGSSQ